MLTKERVYLRAQDERLCSLNRADGKTVWCFKTDPVESLGYIVVGEGVVYFWTNSGRLYCVDDDTGKARWARLPPGRIFSTPFVHAGVVYFGAENGFLYMVNAKTGEELKRMDAGTRSPVVSGNSIFTSSLGFIRSIDLISHKKEWGYSPSHGMVLSLTVGPESALVGTGFNEMVGVDRKSGKEKWRFDCKSLSRSIPLHASGHAYCANSHFTFFAIDANTGEQVWKRHHRPKHNIGGGSYRSCISSAASKTGVIVFSVGRYLFALDQKTGDLKWRFNFGKRLYGGLLVSDKSVFAVTEDGYLYSVDLQNGPGQSKVKSDDGREVWKTKVAEQSLESVAPKPLKGAEVGDGEVGDGG